MRVYTLCLCGLLLVGTSLLGQEPRTGRYFPLNNPLPRPGQAGDWAGRLGKASPVRFQPVQLQLPGAGQVTWYGSKGEADQLAGPAPSMAGLLVGPVYRLKVSDMPEFPGVVIYPTIEMVDRLHPPVGREAEFPVIVSLSEEEIDAATNGQLVTKVVYLEQPNLALLSSAGRGKALAPIRVRSRDNPLEVADLHGRPLAIIRIGGRVPDSNRPEPDFYGSGAPVQMVTLPQKEVADPAPEMDEAPMLNAEDPEAAEVGE